MAGDSIKPYGATGAHPPLYTVDFFLVHWRFRSMNELNYQSGLLPLGLCPDCCAYRGWTVANLKSSFASLNLVTSNLRSLV